MPTKIKSRKGKTATKTRRGKPRLKRGVDVEEGASGRKSDMKKPRRDPTEADAPTRSTRALAPYRWPPATLERVTAKRAPTETDATADESPFLASILLVHRLSGVVLRVISAKHLHTGWGLVTKHFASLTIIGEIEPLHRESGGCKHCHQTGRD